MTGFLKRYGNAALFLVAVLLLSSCASLSPNGVGRMKRYSVGSSSLPDSFDGYRVAFISDIHYPSLFNRPRLAKLVRKLRSEQPDMLLLGGDYVTDGGYADELFDSLSTVAPVDGTYAVYGNHERGNKELIAGAMERCGVVLLADSVVGVVRGDDAIYLAGVYDSFVCDTFAVQPAESVAEEEFVVLLCHTPDYAEISSTTADLVLSGHTHGGQVSLLGVYTPVKNSSFGTRFLRGRNMTTSGATIITTNGVGTSRRKVRFCVPSEIVVVTLRKE